MPGQRISCAVAGRQLVTPSEIEASQFPRTSEHGAATRRHRGGGCLAEVESTPRNLLNATRSASVRNPPCDRRYSFIQARNAEKGYAASSSAACYGCAPTTCYPSRGGGFNHAKKIARRERSGGCRRTRSAWVIVCGDSLDDCRSASTFGQMRRPSEPHAAPTSCQPCKSWGNRCR